MRAAPILVAALHRGDRGQMKAAFDARHGPTDRVRVADVADHDLDARRHIVAASGRQIVEHPRAIAAHP
jgi:hypothetical protein